jgi:hypothetical protein
MPILKPQAQPCKNTTPFLFLFPYYDLTWLRGHRKMNDSRENDTEEEVTTPLTLEEINEVTAEIRF